MVDYYTKTEIDAFFNGKTDPQDPEPEIPKQKVSFIDSLINKPFADVRDFYGDDKGNTDLEAFNAALDALSDGGYLYIPPGTYELDGTFTIDTDNVQIIGAGRDATIIKHKGSTAAFVLISVSASSPNTRDNIRIAHLTLDGNKSTLTGDDQDVLEFVRARYFLVEDVKIINASLNSIYINGDNNGAAIDENAGIIENVWSHSPDHTHVTTGKKLRYLTIRSLYGYNSGKHGISISGTTDKSSVGVDVLGCKLFSSGSGSEGGSGIHVYTIDTDHWGYHKIAYNEIHKSGLGYKGQGILVEGHRGTIVAFNHVWDSQENNINVAASDNCPVIGNICHGTEGSHDYDGNGILTGRSAGCTHLGNVCFDNNLSGIGVVGVNNCLINGNVCKNNGQRTAAQQQERRAGIYLANAIQGTEDIDCFDNVVSGNVCVDDQGTETQEYGIIEYRQKKTLPTPTNSYVGRSLINNNKVHGNTDTILLETDNDGKDSETHNNQTVDDNYGLTAVDPLTLPDDRDTFRLNRDPGAQVLDIDEIKPSWIGRVVTLTFQNNKVKLIDGTQSLRLAGDFQGSYSSSIQLMCWGDKWFEVSRSTNT